MTTAEPLVSIGLPERNGEPWRPTGSRCLLEFARVVVRRGAA